MRTISFERSPADSIPTAPRRSTHTGVITCLTKTPITVNLGKVLATCAPSPAPTQSPTVSPTGDMASIAYKDCGADGTFIKIPTPSTMDSTALQAAVSWRFARVAALVGVGLSKHTQSPLIPRHLTLMPKCRTCTSTSRRSWCCLASRSLFTMGTSTYDCEGVPHIKKDGWILIPSPCKKQQQL